MERKIRAVKILAVETSGRSCSAAVAEIANTGAKEGAQPVLRGEIFYDIGLRHSDILAGCCASLLDTVGWKKEELTHLAASVGPGSFTGIRVGLSFMRALAQALKIPLVGVSTFEILAHQARDSGIENPLCIGFESIGDDLFTGFFGAGQVCPAAEYAIWSAPRLAAELRRRKNFTCLGDGCEKHAHVLSSALGRSTRKISSEMSQPRAATLARIAAKQIAAGKKISSREKILPFYMRPPLAVERLQSKKPQAYKA